MTTGLRTYLLNKAAAMGAAAIRWPAGRDWHEVIEATVVADDVSGVRKLAIRGWEFLGDSGPDFGGQSRGPSSPELFCGVIGTCLTHTYLIGAAVQGVPLDRVAVTVTAENNDARFLAIETSDPPVPFNLVARVMIDAEGVPVEAIAALHTYVEERCPLTQLIRGAYDLTILTT